MSSEIINQQRVWLDKLQVQSKKPILIKALEGKTPEGADHDEYSWVFYKDEFPKLKQPIYTRTILMNEICFDPDVKDWGVLYSEMSKIQTFCRAQGIPLELAYSGGNGIHGHIFFGSFGIDEDNFKNAKKYDINLYEIVRNVLLDIILKGAGTTKQALSLDMKKINISNKRKGSMVREYGTTRPDGHFKTLITEIPKTKAEAQGLPLIFPAEIKLWNVPETWNNQINTAIGAALKQAEERQYYNIEDIDLSGSSLEKFPCLKRLLKYGTQTGRYYAGQSITLMAKKCNLPWKIAEEATKKMLSICDLTPDEITLRIENVKPMFANNDYNFSCRQVKKTFGDDICDFSKCPLSDKIRKIEKANENKEPEAPKHISEKAIEILEQGTPIPFLMEQYHKNHVGDAITGKTILAAVGTQSILNSSGIQPKLSAESGKGKSHAVSSILHLIPRNYLLETSLSGKALFHSDDLKPGTIIFSDDTEPDDDLQEVIKRSSTNFQKTTNHRISVKDGAEWTTKTKTIPPRIVWVLTSVNDNGSLEYLNRQLNLGVDETPDQDVKVMELLLAKAEIGELEFPITDETLICREIIKDIKSKLFKVQIPYAKRIEWNDSKNRRNLSQFLDLIRAFAAFDYRHRNKISEDIIEANEDDFKLALTMYRSRASNQKFKLNDNELNVLMKMVKDQPYTIKQLQDLIKKSDTTIKFLFHGRPGHENGGLLNKVPELEFSKEMEFFGKDEIGDDGEYEKLYTKMKKSKAINTYILRADFNSLTEFGDIASLKIATLKSEMKP